LAGFVIAHIAFVLIMVLLLMMWMVVTVLVVYRKLLVMLMHLMPVFSCRNLEISTNDTHASGQGTWEEDFFRQKQRDGQAS